MQLSIRNFNMYSIISLIVLIAGIALYVTWGLTYNVWADIGIYSITIVLVLSGILGLIISLSLESEEKE
jgi:hypothetical protein